MVGAQSQDCHGSESMIQCLCVELFELCVPFLSFSLFLVLVSFLLSQFCRYACSVIALSLS